MCNIYAVRITVSVGVIFFYLFSVLQSPAEQLQCSDREPLLEEVSLGTPVIAYTLWGSTIARHPEDGRVLLVAGTWSAGGDAPILIFDPEKKTVLKVPIHEAQGTYGVLQGPDKNIYISTVNNATLYRYNLLTESLEELGKPSPTQVWLYNLVAVSQRYLLGGTYGEGRLAGYDLQEKKLVDFGRMKPPEAYVCATAPGPNDTVYCGMGSHAGLIHFDPATGGKKEILPPEFSENSFVYTLRRDGDYLYASVLFDNRILVFDTRNDRLVHDFGPNSSMIGTDSEVWISAGGVTGRWDVERGDWREKVGLPGYTLNVSKDRIAFAFHEGQFSAYELASGKCIGEANTGPGGTGQNIFTLHTGPDGLTYGSSYNLHHIFRVDSESGQTKDIGNPIPPQSGEVYAFANHESLMYMASYTYARLSVYDTKAAWNPGTNPRLLGELGDEQYRTPGLTMGPDGMLYIGSIPTYGKIGGALSRYNPETGKIDVYRNLIQDQSINCLVSDEERGWLLGGSWIVAGGGVEPTEKDAHLFAWDYTDSKLVRDFVPCPGQGMVTAILLLDDGNLLAALGDQLILADMDGEKVLRNFAWPGGGITSLRVFKNTIYVNSGKGLYTLDVKQWKAVKIAPGGNHLSFDSGNHAYYSRGPELFRVDLSPASTRTK